MAMKRTLGHYRLWVSILDVMLSGPVSLREIEKRANVSYESIRDLMKQLRKGGVVHIARWRKDDYNRYNTPLYQLGHGVDAIKPRKSDAKRVAESKQRKQKAEEDKLFEPMTAVKVKNPTIDHALRSWI